MDRQSPTLTTADHRDARPAGPDSRWIQTFTGRAFWPLSPRVKDIDIIDVAHALAMKCRFSGHTRHFYSVAQHSYLASKILPPGDEKWGLLHDASEAYLPDVARPVKKELVGFREIEDRLMQAVAERFGLGWPMPSSIHQADLILLATERRDLMSEPPYRWTSTENVEPLLIKVWPMDPVGAKALFIQRFEELFGARVEA